MLDGCIFSNEHIISSTMSKRKERKHGQQESAIGVPTRPARYEFGQPRGYFNIQSDIPELAGHIGVDEVEAAALEGHSVKPVRLKRRWHVRPGGQVDPVSTSEAGRIVAFTPDHNRSLLPHGGELSSLETLIVEQIKT